MSRIPLDVTPTQRANLQRLADYLLRPTPTAMRFTMGSFMYDSEGDSVDPIAHDCGTAGCAVGHGPAAGIEPEHADTHWIRYASSAFGVQLDEFGCAHGPLWNWCFDGDWTNTDDTARGAGQRIQIALTQGIPFNYAQQRTRRARLEYTP